MLKLNLGLACKIQRSVFSSNQLNIKPTSFVTCHFPDGKIITFQISVVCPFKILHFIRKYTQFKYKIHTNDMKNLHILTLWSFSCCPRDYWLTENEIKTIQIYFSVSFKFTSKPKDISKRFLQKSLKVILFITK